jgi:PAS domain-containing protein
MRESDTSVPGAPGLHPSMNTDRSSLAGITELDAAVQRLLTIRSEHEHAGSPLLKQALSEIDQVIEELQVMFEELSQGRDDVQRLVSAVEQERRRRVELMEALSVACVFTDAQGVIHEANTSALLLLGVSAEGIGRDSLCDVAADPEVCHRLLERAAADGTVVDTLPVRQHGREVVALNASVAQLRNLEAPLWRWFLQRA